LPIVTPAGARIPLGEVECIEVADGLAMVKSENTRSNGWIFVDIEGRCCAYVPL
jgi:Cu(I)/Ag(I) efflux system membrane protein CusA/SilA